MSRILSFLTALGLSLSAFAADVSLMWDPVTDDPRVTGYEVHYGTASGTYTMFVDAASNGAATNIVDVLGLTPGTVYYFAARSVNVDKSLFSQFSNEVVADIPPLLGVPGNLTGTVTLDVNAQTANVDLAWVPITNDPLVAGYEVHYGGASQTYTNVVDVNDAVSNTVTIPDLPMGGSYYFAVRARNVDGSNIGPFSSEFSVSVPNPLHGPSNMSITVTTRVDINQ